MTDSAETTASSESQSPSDENIARVEREQFAAAVGAALDHHERYRFALRSLTLALGSQMVARDAALLGAYAENNGLYIGTSWGADAFEANAKQLRVLHDELWDRLREAGEGLIEEIRQLHELSPDKFTATHLDAAVAAIRQTNKDTHDTEVKSGVKLRSYLATSGHESWDESVAHADIHGEVRALCKTPQRIIEGHWEYLAGIGRIVDEQYARVLGERSGGLLGLIQAIFGEDSEQVHVGKIGETTVVGIDMRGPSRFITNVLKDL